MTFNDWTLVQSCSDLVFTYTSFYIPSGTTETALPSFITFNASLRKFTVNTSNMADRNTYTIIVYGQINNGQKWSTQVTF